MLKKDLIKLIIETEARLRADLQRTKKYNPNPAHVSMARARWATAYDFKMALGEVK